MEVKEKEEYLKTLEEIMELKFLPVESSNAVGYAYNSKKQQLIIAFKNNRVYQYKRVPHEVADAFAMAESKGKFINQEIRGKYDYQGYVLE